MYLSRVQIKGFRNFSDFEVEFREGLNVLVGENNIGKTNLFDAIRIALGPHAFEGFPLRPKPTDRHRDATGNVAAAFEVHLTFSDIEPEDMSAFVECLVYNPTNPRSSTVQIHYRWSWSDETERFSDNRWGGASEDQLIRSDVLQAFPATYLEPLRDALGQLVGGRASKIGQLLQRLSDDGERTALEQLFRSTNTELRSQPLITRTVERIGTNLREAMGSQLAQDVGLAPAAPSFAAIAQSIRMVLQPRSEDGQPRVDDVELLENGLGYNNLLFVATVLAYRTAAHPGDLPLLVVEEPEAHLHPQLQTLLVDYLRVAAKPLEEAKLAEGAADDGTTQAGPKVKGEVRLRRPQVFVTTHSPVLAAHVPPDHLIVMHRPVTKPTCVRATGLWQLGLGTEEVRRLHRLLDVTKSTLLFSRGIIFVEGISEQLIVPELAQRMDRNLGHAAISVIALHGLGFDTVTKLFGPAGVDIRCAIVTDSDPPCEEAQPTISGEEASHWKLAPKLGEESSALKTLRTKMPDCVSVRIFPAIVTLEYDLATAGNNAVAMVELWPRVRGVTPRKFTKAAVEAHNDSSERARLCWQAICLQDEGRFKAAFAHELASVLADKKVPFSIPPYLSEAIDFVLPESTHTPPPTISPDGDAQHTRQS